MDNKEKQYAVYVIFEIDGFSVVTEFLGVTMSTHQAFRWIEEYDLDRLILKLWGFPIVFEYDYKTKDFGLDNRGKSFYSEIHYLREHEEDRDPGIIASVHYHIFEA